MNTRNIIIAIIQNNDNAEDAADMILAIFGQHTEPASAPDPPPRPPKAKTAAAVASTERRSSGRSATKATTPTRPTLVSLSPSSPSDIDPDEYYSMAITQEISGYSMNYLHVMVRENSLVSKKTETGRRLIKGSEILRLHEQHTNGTHQESSDGNDARDVAALGGEGAST